MLEHFEGNMPAIIPRMQVKPKIMPTIGFRQLTSPIFEEVEDVKTDTKMRPAKENTRKKLPIYLKDTIIPP